MQQNDLMDLLMLEKNPTDTPPVFSDGIPVTAREGHGLGVQSFTM